MGLFYDIIAKSGRYEVLINGDFYCFANDLSEAAEEITEYCETEEKSA